MERNYRKTRIGTVVSDKMDKTFVLQIVENKRHPLYGKKHQARPGWKSRRVCEAGYGGRRGDFADCGQIGDTQSTRGCFKIHSDSGFRVSL